MPRRAPAPLTRTLALAALLVGPLAACKGSAAESQQPTADQGPQSVAEIKDWKQRVAIENQEVQRKDPALHQQLTTLQAKAGPGGAPTFEEPIVENNPDASPVLITRLMSGGESKENHQAIAEALPRAGGDWQEPAAALIPLQAEPEVRQALVESMRYAEPPHIVEGLKAGFRDESPAVQAAAARTAGFSKYGGMLYSELLSSLFADDWDVRAASAQSLGKLKMREATSALRRSLGDEHEQVRLYALLALERIDPEGVKTFPEVAKLRQDPSNAVATEANRLSPQ
ncbi:MAG: HEAT repeat domain-containing protein [Nannocystaceae bacterium]|nr:HEAT repeat domain-containing protein [Myxococcales bacterium]